MRTPRRAARALVVPVRLLSSHGVDLVAPLYITPGAVRRRRSIIPAPALRLAGGPARAFLALAVTTAARGGIRGRGKSCNASGCLSAVHIAAVETSAGLGAC